MHKIFLNSTNSIILFFILVLTCFLISSYRYAFQRETNNRPISTRPEPSDWFAGDIHIHRSCNGNIAIPDSMLRKMMKVNDLSVISVLSDMGNSQVTDRIEDLQKVNGKDCLLSGDDHIIHYSAEWHWDANEWVQPHQALGGHLVLLGLSEAHKIWDESPYRILEWAKRQDAVCGFAHMQYLTNQIPDGLNCCIPVDFPVEAALGTIDFVSEDCNGSDTAIEAYYKLLNCGFRIGLAAGTDYPCNGGDPFGTLLTYVHIKDRKLTYRKWINGIKKGNTVISRNGHNEFMDLKVDGKFIPGDEIHIRDSGYVSVEVNWTADKSLKGRIELICNSKVVARLTCAGKSGEPVILHTKQFFTRSGWLCARLMDDNGHRIHTSAVFIAVNNMPVRTNADDALFFVSWIDNILNKISSDGIWNRYFSHDLDLVENRYRKAREIYSEIALDAQNIKK